MVWSGLGELQHPLRSLTLSVLSERTRDSPNGLGLHACSLVPSYSKLVSKVKASGARKKAIAGGSVPIAEGGRKLVPRK